MRRAVPLLLLFAGCANTANPSAAPHVALLGTQLRQQDEQLVGQQFRTILDFENPADAAFIDTNVKATDAGHTGNASLRAGDSATVRVSSLLFGLTLPANWSLLGGYVKPAAGTTVVATLIADGQIVARTSRNVPASAWAFAAIDLSAAECQSMLPTAKSIALRFDAPGAFDLDDVLLVDNRRTLASNSAGWLVQQSGLSIDVQQPGRPPRRIASAAAAVDGWAIEEANAVRLRLRDATGQREWTLTADGRSILDGTSDSAADRSPADIAVDETTCQLNRETPDDADNDGYNETRAAYQITATAPRVRLKLVPHGGDAVSPILEIHGLHTDHATVTVDGRLIDTTARLSDGTWLVMIPLRIDSPVEIIIGEANE